MAYFSNFGSVWYQIEEGNFVLLNDITKSVGFTAKYRDEPGFFLVYKIREGERPEQISRRLYGDGRFAWTIVLFNGLCDYDNQWPLTQDNLDKLIVEKYPGQDYADTHHYVDENGDIADPRALRIVHGLKTEADAIGTFKLSPVTIGDYENSVNESKRSIKLINANHIAKVEKDLKDLLNG